jgi:cellobiose phosphorylase
MANSQTFCPINGKIGNEAEEEWKKYGKLRPDYEEYVKALRYMEKVDAEIMEELDDKESYITDGNGNAVHLGSQE